MTIDHILVIGFGGPTKPEDVRPFLERVTRGIRIPEARLRDVTRHYEAAGGRSPYNEHTQRLVDRLRVALGQRGITLPLRVGMRNWHPFLTDVMRDIQRGGFRRGVGIILAPHRCEASFERYVRAIEEAQPSVSATAIQYDYVPPWHDHPLFIEAQADRVRDTLHRLSPEAREAAHLLFSAHAIPVEMAGRSRYEAELGASSEAVARALGRSSWSAAYQSRSGPPAQPWLEPDIGNALRTLAGQGIRQVVVVPIGFLCDNVEVLYDLDIEAKVEAERLGMGFARASTVMDHPRFVEMFVQLIAGQMQAPRGALAARA